MPDLSLQSASHMLDLLTRREISAVELTRAHLARITRFQPTLNPIAVIDEAGALAAADASDARRARGEAGPLDGLPVTIKDCWDVAGLASSGGLPAYRERVPDEDASPVARLRAAGAIILGKSTVPVFSGDFQSYNPVHGVVNNPWNPARSPGGSSGGAAVSVASGMAALELGTDLGGSIRWPAHASGVCGLKTSWGLIPTWGMLPPPPEKRTARNADLVVAGPIGRCCDDLELALSLLAGPRELPGEQTTLAPPRRVTADGLRIALWNDDPFAKADSGVREGVRKAARLLEAQGAVVDEIARPAFRFEEAFEVYALLNHAIVAYGLPAKVRARIQAMAADFAPDDLSHRALQARGARMTPGFYQQVQARRMSLKRQWARFFERYDVVLCPPAPVLAIPHDHEPDIHRRTLTVDGQARPYLDFLVWASLATGADLPALAMPVDVTRDGLPRGVQIIGPQGADRSVLQVGRMLEALGCGYRPAPMFQGA